MNSKTLKKACLILAGAVLALGLTIRLTEQHHWLSLLPSSLQVSKILYVENDSWGFGPGGNETGVVLYELPESAVQPLLHDDRWSATPMAHSGKWFKTMDGEILPAPSLDNFLNQYGFGIAVNPVITKSINNALSQPGSYFTYTRTGMVIVMPSERRVAFVYAG
jgi:hypothetical protein